MTQIFITVEKDQTALIPNWFDGGTIKVPEGIWLIVKEGETVIQISRAA
jgi:hypothetical protein